MPTNPFLTALKLLFTGALALFVFLGFWQRTHLEDQITTLTRETTALSDKVGEMSRKIEAGGVGIRGSDSPGAIAAPAREWGWERNAALDADLDPSRSPGTPGRYKNYLSLDPDPEVSPASKGHEDSVVGLVYGPQEKTFNPILATAAKVQEELDHYVLDQPAAEHWHDPYRYAPSLCWRVEVSPDHREYTLFFRRDVAWQPVVAEIEKYPHLRGSHRFTANDYKFTIDTILNPQVECAPLRSYFGDCEGVTVVDDFTAVVRWKKTVYHSIGYTLGRWIAPEFLYGFDERGVRFPAETFGQQFNSHFYNRVGMVGCGPYRMLPYDGGEWIEEERSEDWYGVREGERFPVKRRRLLVYTDPETPFLKLRAGEIGILGLTAAQWKKFVADENDPKSPFKDGRIVSYTGLRPLYFYVGWKNSHPLFRDKNVRKALALACNREQIAEKIYLGRLLPMSSPIFPGSPSADPDLKPLPFDRDEAARILDAAGWKMNAETGVREGVVDGQRRTFEFQIVWNSPSPEGKALIDLYRNDLQSIGVVMTPVPLEWSVYLQRLHDREFEAALAAWGTEAWDQDFEQLWHSKQIQEAKSSNYVEYSNPEVDRLSDELRGEMDVERRKEKARRIGRILYEDQPTCFLGWARVKGAHWHWLKNAVDHIYKTRPFVRTFPMWVER